MAYHLLVTLLTHELILWILQGQQVSLLSNVIPVNYYLQNLWKRHQAILRGNVIPVGVSHVLSSSKPRIRIFKRILTLSNHSVDLGGSGEIPFP